jgi:hypothetical protein
VILSLIASLLRTAKQYKAKKVEIRVALLHVPRFPTNYVTGTIMCLHLGHTHLDRMNVTPSNSHDIQGHPSFLSVLHIILDGLAIFQGLESVALFGRIREIRQTTTRGL